MKQRLVLSEVAGVTQRLAVLLEAGVAQGSAWGHVAASTGSMIALEVAAERDLRTADAVMAASNSAGPLERQGWRGLAAAWSVATEAGAPLAPSLRDYARSLRSLSEAQRETLVALAAPVATAKLVMVLPAVSVLFGMALGFNTLGTLLGTPIGWVCLVVGCGLIGVARHWNSRLVAAAQPADATPGLGCDLMAIAVSGGGSLDRARALLEQSIERFGLNAFGTETEEVLELSRAAGVPAAELLRGEADELRRTARADAQEKAASLSVKLMLPLGLCVLPAFMVLGVFPLLVTVISSTVSTF